MTDIFKESKDIEVDLCKSEKSMENIGTLAIRIQKFIRLVNVINSKELKEKGKDFNARITKISNKRLINKRNETEEMIKSKLTPEEPYTECSYYTEKTQKVNHILTDALSVLDRIQKQGKFIGRTGGTMKSGLRKLGLSRDLVHEIDKRYLADNRIFVTGFVLLIIFFLVLRFFYR